MDGLKGRSTKALWDEWPVREPWRSQACCDHTASWLCTEPVDSEEVCVETKENLLALHASGNVGRGFQGNYDWNGHEQALSCCVSNYQCKHAPSLRKTQLSSSMSICISSLVDTFI